MHRSFVIIVGMGLLLCCAEGGRVKAKTQAHVQPESETSAEEMRADDPPLRMTPSTTVQGCNCRADSKCASSITNSTGLFACDWCRVDGDCRRFKVSLGGRWDYCQYPTMVEYEAQTAQQKMKQLWKEVTGKDVVGRAGPKKNLGGVAQSMIGESMRTAFDNHWDVLPEGREKVIHSQGVHCQFELDIAESTFTGLLAKGKPSGIIRMGSATSIDVFGVVFPGLSFKFLRDGRQSGNFVALRQSKASKTTDGFAFFDDSFSKIGSPPAPLRMLKFDQASDCVSMVGLSDVCSYAQDGTSAGDSLDFPYDIQFQASSDKVHLPNKTMTDAELLQHLSNIQEGTELLDVYAKASPKAERKFLGKLRTTSQCVMSAFGDESLFFRHQRMEEDFVKKPEWVADVREEFGPGCKAAAVGNGKWQCPGVQ